MTQTVGRRVVTYQGTAASAAALAQVLEDEGLSIERRWVGVEEADFAGILPDVTSSMLAYGSTAALEAALSRFRHRFPGSGSILIEDDAGRDD